MFNDEFVCLDCGTHLTIRTLAGGAVVFTCKHCLNNAKRSPVTFDPIESAVIENGKRVISAV